MRLFTLLIGLTTFVLWEAVTLAEPSVVKSEFIFTEAPFVSCHASTFAETTAGNYVVAWFGGSREGKPDVGIWVSRLVEGAWTGPVEVANGVQSAEHRWPCWNPVLFQPSRGDLLLFYKVGPSPRTWWGEVRSSADNGKTWSEAKRLPDGIAGPIKNKPIELDDGVLLFPSSTEDHGWRVHFERSPDLGGTWTKTEPVNDGKQIGAIQPSLLQLGGKRLLAIGRTRQQRVFQIASDDLGESWGEMTLTELPNSNTGLDAVTLKNGQHLLIYNHTTKGRTPLNLAVSKDGKKWEAALKFETEPGEYSYPAILQTSDGLVHVTYTWKRQRIKHVVLDPTKLQTKPIAGGVWPK